jgi:histidine ammonia-lyase
MVPDYASHSAIAARATTDVVAAYRIVLACELVAAVRALRLRGVRPTPPTGRSTATSPRRTGCSPRWPG